MSTGTGTGTECEAPTLTGLEKRVRRTGVPPRGFGHKTQAVAPTAQTRRMTSRAHPNRVEALFFASEPSLSPPGHRHAHW